MKFLIDTQLPPKLSHFFSYRKIDSKHTQDYENGIFMDDATIVEIAIKEKRIIVTKDIDFFNNYILKGSPPKVLLLKTGNISNTDLLELIKNNLDSIKLKFENNAHLLIIGKNFVKVYR